MSAGVRETVASYSNGTKYTFEEAWRFLYRYGVIYIQFENNQLITVKTGVTKTDDGLRNIIRFLVDDKEILRIFNRCWDEGKNCEKDITKYKAALIRYIETAYIE